MLSPAFKRPPRSPAAVYSWSSEGRILCQRPIQKLHMAPNLGPLASRFILFFFSSSYSKIWDVTG